MPSDLPTEQYPIQGVAIAIDSLCNPLLKTYSETLNCDASMEVQGANNGPWSSRKSGCVVITAESEPSGGVKPCVWGSPSVWGLLGREFR